MSVFVGKWGWEAVYFKVKGLHDSLMRWLKLMWKGVIWVLGLRGRRWFDVNLHVLAQGAGVGVGLGAAHGLAVVGFRCRVNLRMLLPVAAVGKPSLAKFTLEWLLTCKTNTFHYYSKSFGVKIYHSFWNAFPFVIQLKSSIDGTRIYRMYQRGLEISVIVYFTCHCTGSAHFNRLHIWL